MAKSCNCRRTCIQLETNLRAETMRTYRVVRCMCCDRVLEQIDWSYQVAPFVDAPDPEIRLRSFDDMLIHAGTRLTHAFNTCQDDEIMAMQGYIVACTMQVWKIMAEQGLMPPLAGSAYH